MNHACGVLRLFFLLFHNELKMIEVFLFQRYFFLLFLGGLSVFEQAQKLGNQ